MALSKERITEVEVTLIMIALSFAIKSALPIVGWLIILLVKKLPDWVKAGAKKDV